MDDAEEIRDRWLAQARAEVDDATGLPYFTADATVIGPECGSRWLVGIYYTAWGTYYYPSAIRISYAYLIPNVSIYKHIYYSNHS